MKTSMPAVDEPTGTVRSPVSAGSPAWVRDAGPADCEAIASIYNEAIEAGTGTMDTRLFRGDDFRALLAQLGPRERLLCAVDGATAVVGFAKLRRYSDREGYSVACETSVYVARSHARRGVGSLLQEVLLDAAVTLGYHHVCARILSVNRESLAFHRRFGYEVVGEQRRIGRIRGVWHDVTLMQRLLSEGAEESGALGASLTRLVRALETQPPQTPAEAREVVAAARIDAADLWPYADVDHPIRDGYGRALVCEGESFEVMVMTWAPGDCSAIHDHGVATWGAVQVFGPAEHLIFRIDEGDVLRTDSVARVEPGVVLAVDHDLLHQMHNPEPQPFVSLHVYGTTATGRKATEEARLFDLDERSIQRTNGGVFFCLPESEILGREPGPAGDRETVLRHHRQMAARIRRILSAEDDDALAARLERLDLEIARLEREES